MITRDEWLQAIAAVDLIPVAASDALSMAEFCAFVGLSRSAAKARLDALIRNGKAEATHKQIKRTDGAVLTVVAYRLLKEP